MNTEPLISVLLANWNGARFLNEAIESVQAQSYGRWEMVVVDTGSEDESCSTISRCAGRDRRIKPLFITERMCCPEALNIGLAETRGDFVARIESDDRWHPDRLGAQLDLLRAEGGERVGVCGADVVLIDETGRQLRVKRFPRTHAGCLRAIWYRNPFCHSAVLIRKRALAECGGYSPAFTLVEDLELWLRLGRKWEMANVPQSLVDYRLWGGSLTSRRLRALAWRAFQVRMIQAPRLDYRPPLAARAYSICTLAAALLPSLPVRRIFEWGLQHLGGDGAISPRQSGTRTSQARSQCTR
jgi:glycosyltransferase involved in cell wall biosynthesis